MKFYRAGTEFKCAHCKRWVTSESSAHGPCPVGRRDETTRLAKVRHVLQMWEGGKMKAIIPVNPAMFAATYLLAAAKKHLKALRENGCACNHAGETELQDAVARAEEF